MAKKSVVFKTTGMQRDLSVSAFKAEFAYENMNMRIIPTDDNTLLSLVNERGNISSPIDGIASIEGVPIGHALIDNEYVFFTTSLEDAQDKIYKVWFQEGVLKGKELFSGNLNFDYRHPIETLVFYENSDLKKVYWTDGLNQPRVINIAASNAVMSRWNNTSFDFIRKLRLHETVSVTRMPVSSGMFSPGTIQYAFTYFDKYGQESNIFNVSPLQYISYNDRGGSAEDKVNNSFNIMVDNIDSSFDYVRIYSIHRTSIDSIPSVKRVADVAPSTPSKYYVEEWHSDCNPIEVMIFDDMQHRNTALTLIKPNSIRENITLWNLDSLRYKNIRFPNGDNIPITNTVQVLSTPSGMFFSIHNVEDDNRVLLLEVLVYSKSKIEYIDKGTTGESIDPTELLYKGGDEVVFGTMAQKDNTLFLGDISLKMNMIDNVVKEYFREQTPVFSSTKQLPSVNPAGYYPYKNQLQYGADTIKTFKYLETYRLGVQFQYNTGKWSEPIWIKDIKNTTHVNASYVTKSNTALPEASLLLEDPTILERLAEQGFVRMRPVIVYPSLNDRDCVCQGVLCPTVYNVRDRFNNGPYAQSSWFVRPFAPYEVTSNEEVMNNNLHLSKGAWAEFRHNCPIPDNSKRNAEIQCITENATPFCESEEVPTPLDLDEWVTKHSENFFIDQSIVTLHSPEIEFDDNIKNINTEGLKLRIVGFVPITSNVSDLDILTSTPPNNFLDSKEKAYGFFKVIPKTKNISKYGFKGLMSGIFWIDALTYRKKDEETELENEALLNKEFGFMVYPFHRNGSLNNARSAVNGTKPALLDKKKMSNLRFSYNSHYFDVNDVYYTYEQGDVYKTGIAGVKIFDSDEVTITKLPAPRNLDISEVIYHGNVDTVVTYPLIDDKADGYPIRLTSIQEDSAKGRYDQLFSASIGTLAFDNNEEAFEYTITNKGIDPIRMRYKSTPHAVMVLNLTNNNRTNVLPTLTNYGAMRDEIVAINTMNNDRIGGRRYFWEREHTVNGVYSPTINVNLSEFNGTEDSLGPEYGWLWIGELYRDDVVNRFGGDTEEALENNLWVPCGKPVSFIEEDGAVKNEIILKWSEGDTYYQRYDHLKTYPNSLDDQNAIVEIISFMCETHVNIEGRHDRNRGNMSNLVMSPINFNLFNEVYNQSDNFFNYRTISSERINLNNFPNSITWTKTKTAGEFVDTWTNITMASVLDLDGDKGPVRAIRKFANNLYAFQDKGVSQVLYNENMQIASVEGTPIEIANSGRVSGKRYLTESMGCMNKWSISETPNGLYFIDDINKKIIIFGEKFASPSESLGFKTWITKNATGDIWNPVDFDGIVTHYDKINGDVLFTTKNECLAYSESLGQFSSFYSYEHVPYFMTVNDKKLVLNTAHDGSEYKIWFNNEGQYNIFFGKYRSFYTTVVVNPDMLIDKIFNNIEFRSDSWDNTTLLDDTFDTLTAWNEYQTGSLNLNMIKGQPSSLKRKFRIWHANMPRAYGSRDRLRNTWLYLKLSKETENTNKTVLHDLTVHYFE